MEPQDRRGRLKVRDTKVTSAGAKIADQRAGRVRVHMTNKAEVRARVRAKLGQR